MSSILDGLNQAQAAAVTSAADVVQILAPPGSGKTKTLTTRVAYLLQNHRYKPWNIICLTFTIKSAREMRDRIAKLIGNGMEKKIVLGTFHSVCRRYLVSYGHLIGVPKGFGIADTSDSLSIIKRITKRRRLNIDPKKAQARISQSKSRGIGIDDLLREHHQKRNVDQEEFLTVFEQYEGQLAASNLLDYDDLLVRCSDLLQRHPQCVSNVESVLIDEFQDTNVVQFDLMTLFAAQNKRITTVGDMDQSIYGWRSAEIKNLKRMRQQYPDTLVINLKENYRSSGLILSCANEVIGQDTSRTQKKMVPTHCLGCTPVLRRLPSADIEASWIVSELRRTKALTAKLLNYSDVAILLRSASLSRSIESALGKAGIPYRMIGGRRFYDRLEVKILLDYLRVVSQPNNNDAIARAINIPPRGVGETTTKSLLEESEKSKATLWRILGDIVQGSQKPALKVSKNASAGIGTFAGIVKSCQSRMLSVETRASPEDLLQFIIQKLDFKKYLEKSHPEDHESRWSNVEELVSQTGDFQVCDTSGSHDLGNSNDEALPLVENVLQNQSNASEEALSRFLANVALTTELQQENETTEDGQAPQHQVVISTIHAAKGLEWPMVFVPSAYEGSIPHSRAEDHDEERRLLYVAMTRAQALLYLSCPVRNSSKEESTLCPFLSEKNVQNVLAKQGPSIDPEVASTIARILQREPPSQEDIIHAARTLKSLEDNEWPLDGSESIEAIQTRKARWAEADCGKGKTSASKFRHDLGKVNVQPLHSTSTVNIGFTTTMQGAPAFSYNANSGFTTASAQMQVLSSNTQSEDSAPALAPARGRKKIKLETPATEQPNLLSMWGPQKQSTTYAQSSHKLSREPPYPAKDQIPDIQYQVINDDKRDPLLPMSNHLFNRRLPPKPKPMTGRPFSRSIVEATQSSGYLFLSSSSPPPDDQPQPLLQPQPQDSSCKPVAKSAGAVDQNASRITDKEVENKARSVGVGVGPRKTLGVKRSLAGWQGTGRTGFSVPKKSNLQR